MTNRLTPLAVLATVALLATTACQRAASVGDVAATRATGDFRAPMGVQLWSFREQAKAGTAPMLRMVRGMGFTHVETAGLYGITATQLADTLRAAGLRATSMHVGYEDLRDRPDAVIADAKALGATYVGLAWYPHQGAFTEADARRAIADFNTFGRRMRDAGLTFFYHNHGYEPVAFGDGTLLDLIIRETDPELVKFEMDVLWTWLPGVDPVALIRKYPGRFRLMHIKDMQPGVPRGSLSGGIPAEQKAVIGQGQVNWAALLQAAQADGFVHYYLEDESPEPVANAPRSVAFLSALRY